MLHVSSQYYRQMTPHQRKIMRDTNRYENDHPIFSIHKDLDDVMKKLKE